MDIMKSECYRRRRSTDLRGSSNVKIPNEKVSGYFYAMYYCAAILILVFAAAISWYSVYDSLCFQLNDYEFIHLHNEVCNYPWR